MLSRQLKTLVFCFLAILTLAGSKLAAQDEGFDFNSLIIDAELYIWNRISDALDLFRGGLAGGPALGAEVAVTEYVQLGAYASYEKGVAFPHFIFPFWLVDYYEKKEPFLEFHEGRYATASFGAWRTEKFNDSAETNINRHFPRNKWDVRVQLHAFILSAYATFRPVEFIDFLGGFVGWDYSGDDQRLDYVATRYPADQFGRGLCNVLFGIFEVPVNIMRVTATEGDLPGLSKGLGLGIWRFICREVVGVVELVTFPFGWQPIIQPEYIFPLNQNMNWRTQRPSFHKRY
ncbi:MAG: exosortase system-associated protein, TIGR04073 family [Oligosphaeraceae bacterium]|nr:exosortase system-associated protein, TIGR04073 family [Oligosphaeraceae bacterium]